MKSKFPVWLLCLLLFIALIAGCIAIFLPFLRNLSLTAAAKPETAPSPTPISVEETVAPEEVPTPVPSESSEALIVAEKPEPSPEPTPGSVHIHHYVDGVCDGCGKAPEFYTDFLPEEFYRETEHAGTVIHHDYKVTAYVNPAVGEYEKSLNIYLPYNYDENVPYDVLILVHGGGGSEESWLNDTYDYGDIQMQGRIIFDNMIEKGICKPCLIVCPDAETPFVKIRSLSELLGDDSRPE